MSNLKLASDNFAIQRAIKMCGPDTITKLNEFYNKSGLLQNDYKTYALHLIGETLKVNQSGDTKSNLTQLLLDLGFQKSNVSKMIGAQGFIKQLTDRRSDATTWVASLPISTSYLLSNLDDGTFARAWEQSSFGEKELSKRDVSNLQERFMKPKVSPGKHPPSNLQKALVLLKDYPNLVSVIQAEIDKE